MVWTVILSAMNLIAHCLIPMIMGPAEFGV